jgi:hypothetical protein
MIVVEVRTIKKSELIARALRERWFTTYDESSEYFSDEPDEIKVLSSTELVAMAELIKVETQSQVPLSIICFHLSDIAHSLFLEEQFHWVMFKRDGRGRIYDCYGYDGRYNVPITISRAGDYLRDCDAEFVKRGDGFQNEANPEWEIWAPAPHRVKSVCCGSGESSIPDIWD